MNLNYIMTKWVIPILSLCLAVLVGSCLWIHFRDTPERSASESAMLALKHMVDRPEEIKIIAKSVPDSVFGNRMVSDDDIANISNLMVKINDYVMKKTNDFESFDPTDKEVNSLMTRQMAAMAALRAFSSPLDRDSLKGEFRGLRVKIDYECLSADNVRYKSEYWCFLDPSGKHVLNSFEIPLL